MATSMTDSELRIIGRTSSLFTRVTRIFAHELQVECSFASVPDLMSMDPADYAGNPALKLPILETPGGAWFGASSICRELARRSTLRPSIVWPEALDSPLLSNAQELTLHAMATEVALIMGQSGGTGAQSAHQIKMRNSLVNTMSWLDSNLPRVLVELPEERDLSYLEVTLFCLTTHLPFREVLSTAGYAALTAFCAAFETRPSATVTGYCFSA
jgi:glutathione S-transferase